MGNLYSPERQEEYIKEILKDTKDCIRLNGVTEAWAETERYFLSCHFGHKLSTEMTQRVFERLGYKVEWKKEN